MQQLGISIASRSGFSSAAMAQFAVTAEEAGLSSFFVAERAADALALCQDALSATEHLVVGTAVADVRLRHPALTAVTIAAICESSLGRFVLGLGISNAGFNEGTPGLPAAAPLAYMRDCVEIVRRLLRQPETTYEGTLLRVRGRRLDRPPSGTSAPILVGALLPKMLELAGRIGDSVILNLTTLACLHLFLDHVQRAWIFPAARVPLRGVGDVHS